MDPNANTPPQAPQPTNVMPNASAPVPPVTSGAAPSNQPTPKKSGKKGMMIMAAIILLLAGGAAAYFLWVKKPADKPAASTNATSSTADTTADTSAVPASTLTFDAVAYDLDTSATSGTTTLHAQIQNASSSTTSDDANNYVAVTHPKTWAVYKSVISTNNPFTAYVIVSPAGHYLSIYNEGGVGGVCTPNTTSYTLTKKLTTQTSGVYFTEYSTNNYLGLENFTTVSNPTGTLQKHITLKEGDSNTNTCNMSYPAVLPYTMVTVSKGTTINDKASWNDIKDDTDFVVMLQSLAITKK